MSSEKNINDELLDEQASVDFDDAVDPDEFMEDADFNGFDDEFMEDGESEGGELEDGELDDGELEDGEPEDGEPEDGEPEDGEPEDGELEDGELDDMNDEINGLASELSKVEDELADDTAAIGDEGESEPEAKKTNKVMIISSVAGAVMLGIVGIGMFGGGDTTASKPIQKQTVKPPIHVDDDKPVVVEGETPLVQVKKDNVLANKDVDNKSYVNPEIKKPAVVVAHVEAVTTETIEVASVKKDISEMTVDDFSRKAKTIQSEISNSGLSDADLKSTLIKNRVRAEGINIIDIGSKTKTPFVENQYGKSTNINKVGFESTYYGETVVVTDIFLEGELIFLSGGLYIDTTYSPTNKEKLKLEIQKIKNESIFIAEKAKLDKEKSELALKEKIARATEEGVKKALAKVNKPKKKKDLIEAIEKSAEIEIKTLKKVEPKILVGWTVNGHFTTVKGGYVLNGYLIKSNKGKFYRAIVGENLENYGLIRGYDGNGRFFLGDNYIK